MKLALLLITVLVAIGAHARADDGTRTFAGSLQLDYLAVPTDAHARASTFDGATVELSLKLSKDLTPNMTANVKVCFACHGFEVGVAMVEMRASDELRLRVGRFTPSFGNFPARHDPANHLTSDKPLPYDMGRMVRRTEWNEGILPAPWIDSGVEVAGTHFWDGGHVDYAVFAMSGPKGANESTDFDYTMSHAPGQYYVDNNSEPVVGARLAGAFDLADDTTLAVGASGMAGHYDPDRKLGFAIGGADAVLSVRGVYLRAEYLVRITEVGAAGAADDSFRKDGFYLEGEVPIGKVSLIGRWDGLRRSGSVPTMSALSRHSYLLRYTTGLAVQLSATTRLKTCVEYYQLSDFADELALHLGVATAF